jgi:hypothetical protein
MGPMFILISITSLNRYSIYTIASQVFIYANVAGNVCGGCNIINPFRGLLVIGSPEAGKSWLMVQHVIKQHIEKGFAIFVYDFMYDDLPRIVYNWLLQNGSKYAVRASFYVIK